MILKTLGLRPYLLPSDSETPSRTEILCDKLIKQSNGDSIFMSVREDTDICAFHILSVSYHTQTTIWTSKVSLEKNRSSSKNARSKLHSKKQISPLRNSLANNHTPMDKNISVNEDLYEWAQDKSFIGSAWFCNEFTPLQRAKSPIRNIFNVVTWLGCQWSLVDVDFVDLEKFHSEGQHCMRRLRWYYY